jgi:hypothetical protein
MPVYSVPLSLTMASGASALMDDGVKLASDPAS